MMNILVPALSVAAAASVFLVMAGRNRRIRELRVKTGFAAEGEEIVRVEMQGNDDVAGIAANFNKLGDKLVAYRKTGSALSGMAREKEELDRKIKNFETSLSQMNLLTEIGKEITSCLTVREIAFKLFRNITSTMIAEEVSLLINSEDGKKYYSVARQELKELKESGWCDDPDNILNWCFVNNKEAFLTHASEDYAQYVFKPLINHTGKRMESVIAVPLSISENMIGSIAISCSDPGIFDHFHLDFVRSLSSYVSVAIYNANLYEELGDEKQKSEDLLLNILPQEVAAELKEKGKTEAKQYDNVSVLFTDFFNFTGISEKLSPRELVTILDKCFRAFDEIIEKNGLEKIKTIGDAYLAVCGLPHENPDHARNVINAAKEMMDYLSSNDVIFKMRVGVNSGPVVAGIVGYKKYAYDIWGDTVNTAGRMEQNGEPGKINISGSTYELVKDHFACIYRGKIAAKNKGEIDMYFVE